MKNLVLPLLFIFFFSCQHKENKNTSIKHSEPIIATKKVEENKQIGDTIVMNFKNKKGLFEAQGSLDSIHPKLYIKFKNEVKGKLKASIITTTGTGNIRFNQIIFPDNSSDGPFGMDLEMKLNQNGTYILVIGHSQMAAFPFWGKFNVQIENKKAD